MSYDLFLAWRGLRARPVSTIITLVIIALAIALPITVLTLGDGARQGIIRASDPFGVLVVGAKGSGQQLVLSTILLQGAPVGNMRTSVFESLQADPRAALVVPLALGDNVGGARIVGTSDALLQLRPTVNEPPAFRIASGAFFAADYQAVLGAGAAQSLGLGIGDQFAAAHGVERGLDDDVHETPYTVVGIFDETQSPYDDAVFVSVSSVWKAHEAEGADPGLSALALVPVAASDQLTAALVKPVGFIEANQLWQTFAAGTEAQAAFPGQELGALFDLLAQGERILTIVGYLVLVIAGLTVFLSLYSAIAARQGAIALMRSLGADRLTIFRVVILEALLITLIGALVGRVTGYGASVAIASILSTGSSIPIPIRFLPSLEPLLWLLPIGLGLLAGIIPAVQAYRVDVIEKLFPA
ncbi:MAG: FtsX-like permease family protein [Chloroflexota bacterium]|nr:FtsX-like permease family protein [Chloroflexota bacterium]